MTMVVARSIAVFAYLFGDYMSRVIHLGRHSSPLWAALIVTVLTAVNYAGIREGKLTQNFFTFLECGGLVLIIVAGFGLAPDPVPAAPSAGGSAPWYMGAGIGSAMVFVLFTYGGWNDAAYISAEVRDRRRNMVRALLLSIGIVTVLYLLVNLAYLKGLGYEGMTRSDAVAADLMKRTWGPAGEKLISVMIAIAALTSVNGSMIVGARSNYALGRDWPLLAFHPAGEGARCAAAVPRARVSGGAGNFRAHLRLSAVLQPRLSPHPRARGARCARRGCGGDALRKPGTDHGFRAEEAIAKTVVCPRFLLALSLKAAISPVLIGFGLLAGCAALDRLGDTRITDGVAPVFDPEVPYFPSTDEAVLAMLKLAGTAPGDVVYDLGCGDGRIVIAAAKNFGARGVGIEIDPAPLRMALYRAPRPGVEDRLPFARGDLFETDISEATVVTLFLFETLNRRLLPKLLRELEPGTRIVAHRYGFGDDWLPEKTVQAGASTLYLWTVPKRK